MAIDLSKCIWVRTISEAGRETRERCLVSHRIKTFVQNLYSRYNHHAPCRIFIDPFGGKLLFMHPHKEEVKGTATIKDRLTYVEVVKHDNNGPMMLVQRYHILCFQDEVEQLQKESQKNAARARDQHLANLVALQELRPKGGQVDSNNMLKHIDPSFRENQVPNPGNKVEMH